MTAIGPLTTTFKAPSSCTTTSPQIYQIFTGSQYHLEQGPLFKSGSNCFPSGYDAAPNRYYSPGFCPHGYTAACTRTDSKQTKQPTETALICCPTALRYTCLGAADEASLGCTTTWKGALAVIGVTVVSSGSVSGTTTISETNGRVGAHSIQVRFKDGDPLPITKADSSQSTIRSQSVSRTLSLPTQTPPETALPPPPPTGGGVSTSAAIGIGIGSAAAALILAGGIYLCIYFRWRKMKKARRVPRPRPPPKDPTRASTYTNGIVPSAFELSEDISTSSLRSGRWDPSKRDFMERGRTLTIATARTSRTGLSEELEDTGFGYGPYKKMDEMGGGDGGGFLHPKAAELDYNPMLTAELEAPVEGFEPSLRGVVQRTVDIGRERSHSRSRARGGNRQSTPESVVSSSSWAVMKKDGVVATPWL